MIIRPEPRLYIFDMGGVVCDNADVAPLIAAHLGLTPQQFHRLAESDFRDHTAGRITERVFWERFGARLGRKVSEDLWGTWFRPVLNRDVVEIIRRLKTAARVVCGTNTITSHYEAHRRQGDYACFDAVYASQQIGLVKPDPAFFRHILAAEGRGPDHTVFVDDVAANVEGALSLGIRATVFSGATALEAWLKA